MAAWLKALGTSADPLPDDWSSSAPSLLRQASFGRMPGSIEAGDLLVYYAAGLRKVFAIAEVTAPPYDGGVERGAWRYLCGVRILTMSPFLRDAPSIDVVSAARDLKQTMIRRSHIRLDDAEYARIVDVLTAPLRKGLAV